jgi:hypothetical protein
MTHFYMKRLLLSRALRIPAIVALVLLFSIRAQAGFVPVPVTGYTADVVANGVATATASTTADVDGAGYAFMAADFNPLGALPTAFMPPNNTVYSVTTSGVTFNLAPYNVNNSLRITATNSGTLTVSTPIAVSDIYLLGVSGSGATTATITVTFTDATTQTFTGVAISDWYGGANFAIRGMGRVNVSTNGIDNNPSDPRLYEIKLSLSASNYTKQIASIALAKTTTAGVINIMGVAANTVSSCSAPTVQPYGLSLTPTTTTVAGSFSASIPAADKYLVVRTPLGAALSTPPVNTTTYTVGGSLGNGTIVSISNATTFSSTALTANTVYGYTVFGYNDVCSGGPVYNTTNPLTSTVLTATATSYTDVPASGYTADIVADTSGPASSSTTADVDGAGYAFMAANFNPSGSTFPTSFLPTGGIVNSVGTPGLSYQLKPYTANNSLRITTAIGSGTLALTTPISTSDLYLLLTSGSGATTISATVTFTDATTQTFTNLAVSDWYSGTPYAILGLGRVLISTNAITNSTSDPRLYESRLQLNPANYGKLIASVTVTKTGTAGVIQVMGLGAVVLSSCVAPTTQPTGLKLLTAGSTINLAFTTASPQSNKYLVVRTPAGATLTSTPTNGVIYSVGAPFGNGTIVSISNTNVIADAGLSTGALYRYTIFAYNDLCSGGPLYNKTSPLTDTITTTTGNTYTWTGATNFTFTVPTNWSPARYSPGTSDVLLFNNGANNAVYGVPAQTVSQIIVSNNTIVQLQSTAAVTLTLASDNVSTTDELSVAAGSTLLINGSATTSSSLTLAFSGTGATATIAGTLETFGLVSFGGNNFFNCANATVTVTSTGMLTTGGTQTTAALTGNTITNLIVNGTFNYKYSSTNSPAMATATWGPNSTTMISGFNTPTGGPNGGMNQTFQNFIYDCKSQTSATNWTGTGPLSVAGTFTMSSTGTGSLVFSATQGYSYQVNNYSQIGGTLNLNSGTATATPIFNVSGTFNQTAGTFTSTGGSTGANAPVVNFNGLTTAQNINFYNAAPVGPITYRISNANGINLTGTGTLTSAFNLNNNGGIRVSTAASNPINTTLALTYAATGSTLTYDAPTNLTMTANVFPATSGPANLTINTGGSSNVVNMPFSRTIAGTLTMTSGDISLSTNTLTLGTSATAAGTLTYTAGFIRVGTGGSFVRWFGTSGLPTTAGTGVGFYPIGYNGLNRSVAFFFSSATAVSTGGSIGVSHTNVAGFTNGLSVADGTYTIDTRTNSNWSFTPTTIALSGTIGMQLTGAGLFTSPNPANLRAMKASAVAGAHVAGFGNTAQRSGLAISDLSSAHYIGAAAADITGVYIAITTGNWSTGSTWDIGVAPGVANEAYINPGVTVTANATTNTAKSLNILPGGILSIPSGNTVTLDSMLQNSGALLVTGGTLTVNGRNNVSGILNNGASTINLSSGTINLGPTGGGAMPFQQNGILNVTGGTLNVNGYFNTVALSTNNQSGGNINVDGNAGGVIANSVPCATPIVSLNNAGNTFSGGTFTIVDPHACTTGTNTFVYNNATNITASGTHVFRMGDGVSTDPGGQTPYNFSVNTIISTGRLAFWDLVVNCGTSTNSYFVQGGTTMGVTHDLIVNNGGEFRNSSGQTTYVNNNLTVNTGGTFTSPGTVAFANFQTGTAAASTNTQTVSGAGTFRNLATSPTAKFASLSINNSGGGVTLNIGNVNYSGGLTFTLGKIFTGANILQQNAGASVTGPAQTTGWVVGKFQKNATASGLSHSYPVGDVNFYTPLSINGTAATAGDIVVGCVATDHPSLGSSTISGNRSVNRYWSIAQANGLTFSAAGATVTPNWNAADVDAGATTANFIVGKYNTPTWNTPAVSSPLATSIIATVPATVIDGEYAIGEPCSPLSIVTAPTAQTVCAGSPVTFTIVVGGTSGVLYQWQKNGTPISGATSSTYTIPATATTDAGNYTVVISSQCSSIASITTTAVALAVNAAPSISNHPSSQTLCEHANVTFNVTASGTGITYQWQKNGTPITGATSASYTISNIATSDAGNYQVVVSGATPCGSVTSNVAALNVNALPLTITPASTTTFCAGGSVVLNATTGFSYQWQNTGVNIGGATSASYTATTSGTYTALISNTTTGCNGTSNAIVVSANSAPPSNITPATTAAYCIGDSVLLSGPATGGITYQWYLNTAPISGATNATLWVKTVGSYSLTVSAGTGCSSTSTPTVVSQNSLPTASITAASSTTICQGTTVTLNANTGTGLSYAWNLNGTPITPAATGASYAAGAAGSYTVTVTNTTTGCKNTSSATAVSVNALPTATVTAVGATTFCAGDSVTLNANTGTGLTYVWNYNGNPVTPAATGQSYKAKAAGAYTVTVTNSTTTCQQTSSATNITTNPLPNVTVSTSGPVNMCQGSSVTLSIPVATGQSYQWILNGTNISGATTAAYTTSAAGTYAVVATTTTTGCAATSAGVAVTVNAPPSALITPIGSTSACQGDTVWLNANTGTGLTYQWRRNGTDISGATNTSFGAAIGGTYTVVVTNSANCFTTSTAVTLTINPKPTSNITYTTPITFCEGGAVVLTAVSTSGVSYQWYNNGVAMPSSTLNYYIANTTGSYSVVCTNSFGCSALSPTILVVVNPLPQPVITATGFILSTGSYDQYQWYFNSLPISGATGQSYSVTKNGGYAVRVVDANGCTNYSTVYFYNSVGVQGVVPSSAVKVYPNPASKIVHIDAPIKVNVSLHDATGRIVLKKNEVTELDLSQLADGPYMLFITDQDGRSLKTEKVLKTAE